MESVGISILNESRRRLFWSRSSTLRWLLHPLISDLHTLQNRMPPRKDASAPPAVETAPAPSMGYSETAAQWAALQRTWVTNQVDVLRGYSQRLDLYDIAIRVLLGFFGCYSFDSDSLLGRQGPSLEHELAHFGVRPPLEPGSFAGAALHVVLVSGAEVQECVLLGHHLLGVLFESLVILLPFCGLPRFRVQCS